MSDRPDLLAAAGGIAALLVVGSLFAVLPVLETFPEAEGQALRYALAALVLLALLAARGHLSRPTGRELARLMALAVVGLAAFNLLAAAAVAEGDPATVGVVVGTAPIAFAIAAPLAERRRPDPRVLPAAVLVAIGAAIVQGGGTGLSALGLLFAVLTLGCEVGFSLIAVPLLRSLGPLRTSAYATALAVPPLGAIALLTGPLEAPSGEQIAALAYLALGATALAFVLWYRAVERLGTERAGLLTGTMPVGALLGAAILGTGSATVQQALGTGLVAAGIAVGLSTRAAIVAPAPLVPEAVAPRSPAAAHDAP